MYTIHTYIYRLTRRY